MQLSKFTNVVKGWQYRWFVLEPEAGRLEYHLLEDRSVEFVDHCQKFSPGMVGAGAVSNWQGRWWCQVKRMDRLFQSTLQVGR